MISEAIYILAIEVTSLRTLNAAFYDNSDLPDVINYHHAYSNKRYNAQSSTCPIWDEF